MGTPAIKGTLAAIRQPDRVTFDPQKGITRYAVFESASETNIDLLAEAYLILRLPYTITSTGTKIRLEVAFIGGDSLNPTPIDTWQILGNEIQKSQWEHNALLGFDPDFIALAQTSIDKGKTSSDFQSQLEEDSDLSPGDIDTLMGFYNLVRRGSTHFALGQYVLKHSTNVGQGYSSNVSDSGVERLYTTAQLIAETTDPGLWTYPLPGRLRAKIESIVAPPDRPGYLWSWRKLPSTEATAAGGRVEISSEYWLEQWSMLDYSPL